jgi:predicted type IV restriction endonuclease
MTIPEQLKVLVARFEEHKDVYTSGRYNETQVRQEFINPFFKLLGWDVDNEHGYAEQYKDVIHEDAIKIGGHTKAPDYGFRIGGVTKFYLEAKKPSVRLKDDVPAAFQLRRYAWTAKLPLSVLTDFEELAVYDARIPPKKTDKASTARVMYYQYNDYAEAWGEISAVFSRDAVLKGSFDKYAQSSKRKRGTTEVDDQFLTEIESWRRELARNVALRNKELTQREINFVVQRTIDRIIFLRICEDRGIEEYGQLQGISKDAGVYERLLTLFQKADDRYNSGLFHFKKEKGRTEPPDSLTPGVAVDDKALRPILGRLYYPDSPYEFSVLPTEILGNVYEQFLGSVITLDGRHRATVEQKPEVRKAGGVYYTPDYIVDYIVQNTLGTFLEGKKPGPRSTSVNNLRILDPACGSGSFLIGAYQCLLDWHRDKYVEAGPEKHKKALFQSPGGEWRLTTEEKKRILLNNIYGVDIDPQAVEVTKLSLLLKVLEGENKETMRKQLQIFQERALPDLSNNIKCGNSLIGPQLYQQRTPLGEEDQYRINAFDWQAEFPEVMTAGGFDVVIGNPPYIRIQAMKEWAPVEVEFYKEKYTTASKGNYDIYIVFVDRGFQLLNDKGRLGFILPHKFFNAKYGQTMRTLLAQGRHLSEIVHFGDEQVFEDASTYTCLLFLDKRARDSFRFVKAHNLAAWRLREPMPEGDIPADKVPLEDDWNFVPGPGGALFDRLRALPTKLEDVTDRIFQGLKTSADKIYIIREQDRQQGKLKIYSPEKDAEYWLEPDLLHPLIKGGDSRRYHLSTTDRLILFPYQDAKLISNATFRKQYPLTWTYLKDNKKYLEDRERGRMHGAGWYGYIYPKALDVMSLPKIFTPDIASRAAFSLDETGDVFFTGGVAGGYGILVNAKYSRAYILGLLNSKLLEWLIRQTATQMRGGYYSYESRFIRHLPIELADKTTQKQLIQFVEQILKARKDQAAARTPQARTVLDRQIETLDRQIDQAVYSIYGLTPDEIRIVEAEVAS